MCPWNPGPVLMRKKVGVVTEAELADLYETIERLQRQAENLAADLGEIKSVVRSVLLNGSSSE